MANEDDEEHDNPHQHTRIGDIEGWPAGHVNVQYAYGDVREIHIEEVNHLSPHHPVDDVPDCTAEYEAHGEARTLDVPWKGEKDIEDDAQRNKGDDDKERRLDGRRVAVKEPEGNSGIEDI